MKVALHPAMTVAQAQQVCTQIGARIVQDGRGFAKLVPIPVAPKVFKPCDDCRAVVCHEFGFCMKPTPTEAA